jgi:hypothetical protein
MNQVPGWAQNTMGFGHGHSGYGWCDSGGWGASLYKVEAVCDLVLTFSVRYYLEHTC